MRLGEAPDDIPSQVDVRTRALGPAKRIDGGVVDRLIRRLSNGAQISRVHSAAQSLNRRGSRHVGFNDQEHVCGLSRVFRVDMDRNTPVASLAMALNEVASVENAGPNFLTVLPFEMPDVAASVLDLEHAWAARDLVSAREAMAYEPGDASVLVGLLDSGIAPKHGDTQGRFRSGFDSVQFGAGDFSTGVTLLGDSKRVDTKPIDEYVGHGMACAGIIGARGDSIPPGLAGECPMLPIRVLGAAKLPGKNQAVGLGAITDIDLGMQMAVELGAKVLNMSFGTLNSMLDPLAPKPHADVVRYALMRGCVLVAASGNSGKDEIYWPAAHEGVIAVGSVGLESRPSAFSTRGAHVALCAVGEKVATCDIQGYQLATGTSFAAPFVTAVAALLVSRAQRRSFPLNGRDVRRILMATATPWADPTVRGCGAGVLNALAALQALDREIDDSPTADADPDITE
jgi:subtilisin family serine protease